MRQFAISYAAFLGLFLGFMFIANKMSRITPQFYIFALALMVCLGAWLIIKFRHNYSKPYRSHLITLLGFAAMMLFVWVYDDQIISRAVTQYLAVALFLVPLWLSSEFCLKLSRQWFDQLLSIAKKV